MEWAAEWEYGIDLLTFCVFFHTCGLNIVARFIEPQGVQRRREQSMFFSIIVTALVAMTAALLQVSGSLRVGVSLCVPSRYSRFGFRFPLFTWGIHYVWQLRRLS